MKREARVNVRVPKPMMDEVDRICFGHPEFNYNRQQFIESAVRERIERIRQLEAGLQHADDMHPRRNPLETRSKAKV